MFEFIKPRAVTIPSLGVLRRKAGFWRGEIALDEFMVPLAILGDRRAPDPTALNEAMVLADVWNKARVEVAQELYQHFHACAYGVLANSIEPRIPLSAINSPADVWNYARVKAASVSPVGHALYSEVVLDVEWDDEHTLGAWFIRGTLVELKGSVIAV